MSSTRSPIRGRQRTRSPYSEVSRPDSRSPSRPRRSITPRSRSASHSPRRNGTYRSQSASRSPSPAHSRSPPPSTKIVIEKLTKNVTENHLKEIFEAYGTIRDLDMPLNRSFGHNRGTAYILYANESHAESAIAHMHEAQLDGAIINVSIVLPRRKFSPAPPPARRGANIDASRMAPSNFRGQPPPRRRSPPPSYGRPGRGQDTWRPRSVSRSRSRSPRRHRTRSRSISRSRSRSPPRRRGVSPGRNGGRRRRSRSYSSYSSRGGRSRSRSRDREGRSGGRGRGRR